MIAINGGKGGGGGLSGDGGLGGDETRQNAPRPAPAGPQQNVGTPDTVAVIGECTLVKAGTAGQPGRAAPGVGLDGGEGGAGGTLDQATVDLPDGTSFTPPAGTGAGGTGGTGGDAGFGGAGGVDVGAAGSKRGGTGANGSHGANGGRGTIVIAY
ncbi:hypothetical protein ACIF6L_38520 [Kitasatospora sp. NPDC086009]|uniref:hypothetical protein n=1 Tax=unclassified Kitasatospora TaxID=2633591 RepID=UPI0037C5BC1A